MVIFHPTLEDQDMETPTPNNALIASLNPPVRGRLHYFRRDWQTNKCSNIVLNIITNGYVLPFISKPHLVRASVIRSGYKALSCCIQSLLSKNTIEMNEMVENVKSRVLQSPVSSPQASSKVEASNRSKQAQHLPTCKKVQNGNTRVHKGLSDSRGMGDVDRLIRCLHIPFYPNSRKYLRCCYKSQLFQFTSLPFRLATAPQVFTMIVKEVKLMALTKGIRFTSTLTTGLSGPSLRKHK